jgi:hypothetical protein
LEEEDGRAEEDEAIDDVEARDEEAVREALRKEISLCASEKSPSTDVCIDAREATEAADRLARTDSAAANREETDAANAWDGLRETVVTAATRPVAADETVTV